MTDYVLGFIFSNDLSQVYLLRKLKPEWMCGRLNGIGGKIERNESPMKAMQRESMEESGYKGDWHCFGSMRGPYFTCACFYSVMEAGQNAPETRETEQVERFSLDDLPKLSKTMIGNVSALINAALYHMRYHSNAKPDFLIVYQD